MTCSPFLRPAAALVSVTTVLLLSACASSPAQLDLAGRNARPTSPSPAGANEKPAASRIEVHLLPLIDGRADHWQTHQGNVAGRTVEVSELLTWIDLALADLAGERFLIRRSENAPPGVWSVQPVLLKAYSSSLSVSKTATLLLDLTLTDPHGRARRHTHRGQVTNANWASATGELESSWRQALERCIASIAASIDTSLRYHEHLAP